MTLRSLHLRSVAFRAALAAAGYDLTAVAAACGVSLSTARAWSRGEYPIPGGRLEALARLVSAPVARRLAELAKPPSTAPRGPGRGRLPAPGSHAERCALRVAEAVKRRKEAAQEP